MVSDIKKKWKRVLRPSIETSMSRSMWKSNYYDFFEKSHRVEAFDPTAVVLTGGVGGGMLILISNTVLFS